MADLTLEGLLKTPEDIRREQIEQLQKLGQTQAAAGKKAPTGSAIADIILGMGNMAAQYAPMDADLMKRGITAALGVPELGRSGEERRAGTITQLTKKYGTTADGLAKTADELDAMGDSATATKFRALSQKKKLEEREMSIKEREVDIKDREAIIKEKKLRLEERINKAVTTLGVNAGTLNNSTSESVDKAVNYAEQTGDTQGARELLKSKPSAKTVINFADKGKNKFYEKLSELQATKITDLRDAGRAAVASMSNLQEMQKLSKAGIYEGLTGTVELNITKALYEAGLTDDPKLANTEEFLLRGANETIALLKTGALGTGISISNKDREFMEAISGGKITLTKETIDRWLRVRTSVTTQAIKVHNDYAQEMNERYGLEGVQKIPIMKFRGMQKTENGEKFIWNGNSWIKQKD